MSIPMCSLDLNILMRKVGRSWAANDTDAKTVEKVKFTPSLKDGKIGLIGEKSGTTPLWMSGDRLIHVQSQRFAVMDNAGRLVWSDGSMSEFEGGLCG